MNQKRRYAPRWCAKTINEAKALISEIPEYKHTDYKGRETRYKPRRDSKAMRGARHGDFYITYSIPKRGKGVVASLWMEPKSDSGHGVKMRLHIDINKLLGPMLEEYLSHDFQKISEPWMSWKHNRHNEFVESTE